MVNSFFFHIAHIHFQLASTAVTNVIPAPVGNAKAVSVKPPKNAGKSAPRTTAAPQIQSTTTKASKKGKEKAGNIFSLDLFLFYLRTNFRFVSFRFASS